MNWRFVLWPKWILGHVIIVGFVVLFLILANWQFSRYHGRVDANRGIRAAEKAPPLVISGTQLPPQANGFRNVSAQGHWVPSMVLQSYPIVDGIAGYYVLQPLGLGSGGAVIVNRGFVPEDQVGTAVVATGDVTVVGTLRDGEHTSKPVRTVDGTPTVSAADLAKVADAAGVSPVAPKWIALTGPVKVGDLKPVEGPELDNGPHLAYALQWIAFCFLAVIGWGAVLYRTARDAADEQGPIER